MDRRLSDDSAERFSAYLDGLSSVIGHAARIAPLRDYCRGLLLPGERKSVEPMAAATAPARVSAQHQALLHFVGEGGWSDETMLAKVRDMVLPNIERILDFMEAELGKSAWFAGPEFSAADVQMSFPLEAASVRGGLNESRPRLWTFLKTIHARPAYLRALEKGGQYDFLR